ncbi:SRPBCC family protein [Streptomyces sp. NPDC055897]
MSSTRRVGARAALFALPLTLAVLGAASAPAGAASQPAKSLTCQGKGVDPEAAVRYRTETVIHAPLSTIWKLQTDVRRWPSWQAPVATVERLYHGPLRPGAAFRWTTPVPANPATPATTLTITSTVQQMKHNACIRWTGPADAQGLHIDGVHVWNFIKVKGGVLVRTEETHTGPQVDANVPAATELLSGGLEGWLRDLKTAAEARRGEGPR